MAAATVAVTQGRVANLLTLAGILVTVTGDSTTYATSSGGFPFDLYAALTQASPDFGRIDYRDIVAVVPVGCSTGKYLLSAPAQGTATSSTLPYTVRLYGKSGSIATEVDDGANSDVFQLLVLISRGAAE